MEPQDQYQCDKRKTLLGRALVRISRHSTRGTTKPQTWRIRTLSPRALMEWNRVIIPGTVLRLGNERLLITTARIIPPINQIVALRMIGPTRSQQSEWTVQHVETIDSSDRPTHYIRLAH